MPDHLNRKPPSAKIKKEMERLKSLKTTIVQTFRTTQDEKNSLIPRPCADSSFQFLEIFSFSGLLVLVSIVRALDAPSHESRQVLTAFFTITNG